MNHYDQFEVGVAASTQVARFPYQRRARRTSTLVGSAIAIAVITLVSVGCKKPAAEKAKPAEPAKVAHHLEESALNTITLTPQAEERLGIVLVEAQMRQLPRHRVIGGEVVLPPGQLVTISAPLAGTLSAVADRPAWVPGQRVTAGEPLLQFMPLLTPERDVLTPAERVRVAQTRADIATAQIEAERQIETAQVAIEAAQIAYDRAAQLLKIKAGSQRTVDEADATLRLAQEALETAEQRHKFLSGIQLDEQPGRLLTQTISSPVDGVLQNIPSAIGETVSAGDALFSVMKTDRMWIRVPVYVGQWRTVDTRQPAMVAEYGESPGSEARSARYVAAPPTADALATTVDIYYELEKSDSQLYPGQVLAVTVPVRTRSESLAVPFAAVLYDIHGGAWVYEQLEPHVYARRRVAVEYISGSDAVLAAGPRPGAQVVTDGAAELMGTEFGVGH